MIAKNHRGALRDSAAPLEEFMLANAPISSEPRTIKVKGGQEVTITPGFLRSRIKRKASLNAKGRTNRRFGAGDFARVRTGVFKVPYIGHIEFGTQHMAAQPFIGPAKVRVPDAIRIFNRRVVERSERTLRRMKTK